MNSFLCPEHDLKRLPWLRPSLRKWGNGRDCVESFGRTKDDVKVLAHLIAGQTHTKENYEEQPW